MLSTAVGNYLWCLGIDHLPVFSGYAAIDRSNSCCDNGATMPFTIFRNVMINIE